MSDDAELDDLEAELVHGRATGDLAEVRAQRIQSLTEQLAAAQAVISEAERLLRDGFNTPRATFRIATALGILSQSPTDALQAHDRQVAAKAWDDGCLAAHRTMQDGRSRDNPYRAASLVPGNPEPTEGENRG